MTTTVDQLREQVLDKRPILREVLVKRGVKTVAEYSKEYVDVYMNPPIQARQDEFITTFAEEVAATLGETIASSVERQLRRYYFVSTADHHGPVCHPYFLNSNLAIAAPIVAQKDPILENIIVLSCANVSLDNSSFPRGLMFHSSNPDKTGICRIPFFSSHERPPLVNLLRSYGVPELAKARKAIGSLLREQAITSHQADELLQLITDVYNQPDVLALPNYSRQITKTNQQLWKRFFQTTETKLPNLVYIEMEQIVSRLLMQHHLQQDTIVNHHLFDDIYHDLTLQHFNGILGAFSLTKKVGTYLFWALPKGGRYRLQLWKQGRYLVSADGTYKIELTPEAIQAGLISKELIPGLMLIFIVLSFYYGLKCLGGFNQINYLTAMKNAYLKIQIEQGNYRSIEVCARAQTKEVNDGLMLAFLENRRHEYIPAMGLDLLLYGNHDTWTHIEQTAQTLTVQEAIDPSLPDMYSVVYPFTDRDANLMQITTQDIIQATDLHRRIQPCARIA